MPKEVIKKKWRSAVKREMKKAARREAKAISGKDKPTFLYRWEHVKAVVSNAKALARLTEGDEQIVEAAAWLHDVKKFDARDKHPRAGAAFARDFLLKTDFPPDKIEAVAKAIEGHMGLWRSRPLKNLEAAILWDADKLTKIGVTAALHWVGGSLAKAAKPLTTSDLQKIGQGVGWQKKTVASMHTTPARVAAKKRYKAFCSLWKQLEAELSASDLSG